MDIQITYTAQYGLEWRIVLPEHPTDRRSDGLHEFRLPDDFSDEEFPTQEACVVPELEPRAYKVGN